MMRSLGHWAARRGARNVYLQVAQENAGASDVALTDADLARIEEAFPKHATAGDRYTNMSSVDG